MAIQWTDNSDYLFGKINKLTKFETPLRIASFDLDFTLINRPKRGDGDWTLWNSNIPNVIQELIKNNYAIVIFTNQGGMSMNKNFDIEKWKGRLEEIMKPVLKGKYLFMVYAAKKYDVYRKPNIGMWNLMKQELGTKISNKSFFCGDAAGRKQDFSDTDRKFALNIGINFFTPEEVFTNDFKKQNEKFTMTGFNPGEFLEKHGNNKFDYDFKPRKKELIIMMGYPGSGKTEFVKKYILPHDYVHVNQDTCKTKAKCLTLTERALIKGKSVVIDNTNMDPLTRSLYIVLALRHDYVHIRCIQLVMDLELAKHLNNVRNIYSGGDIPKVSDIGYKIMAKKYIAPEKSEKFDKIEVIDVDYFDVDKLNDPKWKKIFMQWSEA